MTSPVLRSMLTWIVGDSPASSVDRAAIRAHNAEIVAVLDEPRHLVRAIGA